MILFARPSFHRPSRRHSLVAAVLALTVLGLGLFAVAPQLHDQLHHDHDHAHADAAEHYCAVDMFAAGVALTVAVALLRPVALLALGSIQPVTRVTLPAVAWILPPGRGPPAHSNA